jgi:hypothetical protein
VGDWDVTELDLNGDGDWSDANEYLDDRTHNADNELTARDVDDDGPDDYTFTYDADGDVDGDCDATDASRIQKAATKPHESASLIVTGGG